MQQLLSHLHDKGTYAAALGTAAWFAQQLDIDSAIKVLIGVFTLLVLFFTIQEKRQKIRLTKLKIQTEKKEHNLSEED